MSSWIEIQTSGLADQCKEVKLAGRKETCNLGRYIEQQDKIWLWNTFNHKIDRVRLATITDCVSLITQQIAIAKDKIIAHQFTPKTCQSFEVTLKYKNITVKLIRNLADKRL